MRASARIGRIKSRFRVFIIASLLTAEVIGCPAQAFPADQTGSGLLMAGAAPGALARQQAEPRPEEAARALLDAFDRYPVVALGMSHRQQDEADFSLALIRDPRFAAKVQNVVVENGNALYQDLLDRYIAGGDVPLEQLQLVWRNTTQTLGLDAVNPANGKLLIKELFDTVREVNRHLPAAGRIRVSAQTRRRSKTLSPA
jgi:hypothetical protein